MEMFSTRLSGIAHCIVPKLPVESAVLIQPSLPLLPQILNSQLPIGSSNQIMIQPPSIVQIIMPSLPQNTFPDTIDHQNSPPVTTATEATSFTHEPTLASSTDNIIGGEEAHNSSKIEEVYVANKTLENRLSEQHQENSNDIPIDGTPTFNADVIEPEEIPDVNQKHIDTK